MSENKPKVIVLDEGVLTMKSIMAWGATKKKILDGLIPENTFLPPVSYMWFMMCIGFLKRIGVNKDDIVIIARDKTRSWRKFFYIPYKANRWEQREEKKHIDWKYHYGVIDKFLDQIQESTNFHVIWEPNLCNGVDLLLSEDGQRLLNEDEIDENLYLKNWGAEADDIIACASKYYSDREVIFASIDADLDQLCVRDNTKFFVLNQKFRGGKGVYKQIANGYQVLSKKIEKGDVSDNIKPGITDNNTPNDQELRKLIIDLINLPPYIEDKLFKVFKNLPKKEVNYDLLPFPDSLAKRFEQIYDGDKIVTVEDSIKFFERKKKKVAKKAKEKRELKKLEKAKEKMRG